MTKSPADREQKGVSHLMRRYPTTSVWLALIFAVELAILIHAVATH